MTKTWFKLNLHSHTILKSHLSKKKKKLRFHSGMEIKREVRIKVYAKEENGLSLSLQGF
jgi:hypothetical protein